MRPADPRNHASRAADAGRRSRPRLTLRDVVQKTDTAAGRWFDGCVLLLIVASVVPMSMSTIRGLPPMWLPAIVVAEYVFIVLFTVEYVLRIATADRKWRYILSFYGILDLVALLSFYTALAWGGMMDLRAVRALRLLRIFRVFQVPRYNAAMLRIGRAMKYARDEAMVFLFATILLLYIAAMGIHHFESQAQPEKFDSVFHSLWWAVVTLTTVGYGDAYPITLGGRVWTFMVLLLGMAIVAVPAGLIATGLARAIEEERREKEEGVEQKEGEREAGPREGEHRGHGGAD